MTVIKENITTSQQKSDAEHEVCHHDGCIHILRVLVVVFFCFC